VVVSFVRARKFKVGTWTNRTRDPQSTAMNATNRGVTHGCRQKPAPCGPRIGSPKNLHQHTNMAEANCKSSTKRETLQHFVLTGKS